MATATGATQPWPFLGIKLGSSSHGRSRQGPPSISVAEGKKSSSMNANARAVSTPRDPSPTSPRTPTPSSGASFLQEVDVWMENIGKLMVALEEKHRQRQFGGVIRGGGMGEGGGIVPPPRNPGRLADTNVHALSSSEMKTQRQATT